ncbi:MAG: fused MFS/spermidine synthase [Gammaproteobacteria bacterium]|nr:fused MFS/spermidine synthase [Gammaproteobacteria bacterium]NNC98436.1 fused MFS/spermidine synthase [Gammaproteobacteria bacterium]NNM14743.1 fused MFS/spermidine synthase [Gammaproteobacteria bacterium]
MLRKVFLILIVASIFVSSSLQARVIHKERSLYRNIMVTQESGQRCLMFTIRRSAKSRQSCVDLRNPKRLVFRYAQVSMTSFALQAKPEKILIIGLGGGTLPMTYADLLPEADITSVEIDPAVTKVAEEFFDFKRSERNRVAEIDARVFVKRALRKQQKYDLIVLDAFNGDYIPEHLMTAEFLQEVKDLMDNDGVLVANTFSSSKLYSHESATYQSVFGEFYNFKIPLGNRVIIASMNKLPGYKTLIEQAQKLELPLQDLDVSLMDNISLIKPNPDWNPKARILTDQFAPANLLQGKK